MSGYQGTGAGVPLAPFPLTGNESIWTDTGLNQGQNPASEAVSIAQIHTFAVAPTAVPYAATITDDLSTSSSFTTTLTGNAVLANPTNLTSGRTWRHVITQDGTGSRTLTYGNQYTWVGGAAPTLSTVAGRVDMLTFFYDGVKIRGSAQINFA